MCDLYDALIEGIPRDITVTKSTVGNIWTAVCTQNGIGLAMTTQVSTIEQSISGEVCGMKLADLASHAKSWNFIEAGLGMAAINAYYNSLPIARQNGVLLPGADPLEQDAFITSYDEMRNKRVCIVGHFPFLERRMRDLCDMAILERQPKDGDYPDPACEYLLPKADFVFITGSAFINKTMPRLLELSKDAKTTLVGTSVPLAPTLFRFGADSLAGFLPVDKHRCWDIVTKEHGNSLSDAGQRVRLLKNTGEACDGRHS